MSTNVHVKMLINARHEPRVALVKNQQLQSLDQQAPNDETLKNIYNGTVTGIETSIEAAFVDFGLGKSGFLPFKEIHKNYKGSGKSKDTAPIKIGQKVLVQVEKEERGTKGAALSTYISLAGSYLVIMPFSEKAGGISRRIEGEERANLRGYIEKLDVPAGMGVIARTAGIGRSFEELAWDLESLKHQWQAIIEASETNAAPCLIHRESDVLFRAVRDNLGHNIESIIVDDRTAFEKISHYLQQMRPDFVEKLEFHQSNIPLFTHHQIEQQIEAIYQRSIDLPSGGSIVFDSTEALVAIDVNSARATKGSDIEETAFHTNLEAAREIARQLRLRDLGGLIVIDFIDMSSKANRDEVEKTLNKALSQDRARIQTCHISRLGLLEMSRQRLRSSLHDVERIPCPRCNGRGAVRSIESFAASILRVLEENATYEHTPILQIQIPVDVATYLINEKRQALLDIEQRQNVTILVIPNANFDIPRYQLRRMRDDSGDDNSDGSPSYQMVQQSQRAVYIPDSNQNRQSRPLVERSLSNIAHPSERSGLIRRVWESMFTQTEKPKTNAGTSRSRSRGGSGNRRTQPNRRSDGNTSQRVNRSRTSASPSRSDSAGNRTPRTENQAQSQSSPAINEDNRGNMIDPNEKKSNSARSGNRRNRPRHTEGSPRGSRRRSNTRNTTRSSSGRNNPLRPSDELEGL